MARLSKLSKLKVGKHTYWTTKTGGRRVYFGDVGITKGIMRSLMPTFFSRQLHEKSPHFCGLSLKIGATGFEPATF